VREVLEELLGWWRRGEPAALATVVATFRSAPRGPGAAMLVGPRGAVSGSVSGGCVEGAVYELATEVIATGTPALARYGVSDDDAFAVGLTCGGVIDVFVQRVDRRRWPWLDEVAAAVHAGRPVAMATVIEHPDAARVGATMLVWPDGATGGTGHGRNGAGGPSQSDTGGSGGPGPAETGYSGGPGPAGTGGEGALGSRRIDDAVFDDARGLLAAGRSATLEYGPDGQRRGEGMRVFVSSFAPRPRMVVFGAIDFAAAVARVGSFLGYRVTVCDARPVFATAARFPAADEVVVDWPHRYLRAEADAGRLDARTVVAVLTHDPKFDVPVLEVALRLDLAYVGAMGSRRTHDDRLARLREAGLTDAELARLSSPIGLDLGARTPEETAVSIAAEIIALRWGGRGERLSGMAGAIHHAGSAAAASNF
jgi:xanthine dehydrogenase accessory factor